MKLVLVEWEDACGGERRGWRPLIDMATHGPVRGFSVGWLIVESTKHVTLVPHVMDGMGDGEIAIPRDFVTRITSLKLPPKAKGPA